MPEPATTVTVLTLPGRGAVASVCIEGRGATDLVDRCFTSASGKRLAALPLRRITVGRWQSGDGPGEELVVCRLEAERVEVHCHGGSAAVESIVTSLVAAGVVRQSPAAWIAAEEPDRIAAEARLALPDAKTERTALILLDQYHGALQREVAEIIACFEHRDLINGETRLRRLSHHSAAGLHLTQPWRIAIAGPPNVGKSSLMNALVGYSRSIVFDQPGTTRDLVTADTAFDGWPVQLIDTAGLREADDAIESAGVARARETLAQCDLCLRVTDSVAFADSPGDFDPSVDLHRPNIAVLNKIDLEINRDGLVWPGVKVSAKTGEGVPELMRAVITALIGESPQRGDAVPISPRQAALIAQAELSAGAKDFPNAVLALRTLLG